MNTGENQQGLRQIIDFTRLLSLVLLLVIDPVAIVGMVAGALAVFAGLLMTLRTGSDEL